MIKIGLSMRPKSHCQPALGFDGLRSLVERGPRPVPGLWTLINTEGCGYYTLSQLGPPIAHTTQLATFRAISPNKADQKILLKTAL